MNASLARRAGTRYIDTSRVLLLRADSVRYCRYRSGLQEGLGRQVWLGFLTGKKPGCHFPVRKHDFEVRSPPRAEGRLRRRKDLAP
jgi:hypothetical protein